MSLEEKVAAAGFSTHTSKNFDEIRALGALAADYSAGVLTKVQEFDVSEGVITYVVKRLGAVKVMSFELQFEHATEGGKHRLSLVPGDYLTSQATVLFIPVGPKESAGYPPLRSFSEFMRNQLG